MTLRESSSFKQVALDVLKQQADLVEVPDEKDRAIKWLFTVHEDKEQETKEFGALLKLYEHTLTREREIGRNVSLGPTLQETFRYNLFPRAMLVGGGLLYALPREEGASLIVVSDLHGHRQGLEPAIRAFLEDPEKNHLASLGDMYTFGPAGDARAPVSVLKALLKLACLHPDRVHLLRGNNETDIAPAGGWGESLYAAEGDRGMVMNERRTNRIVAQLPLMLMTEGGLVALHGNLPGSRKVQGESSFRSLSELINTLQTNARSVFRLIWREKKKFGVPQRKEDFADTVQQADGQDVLGALDAVAGESSVEIVGHQHSFAALSKGHPGYRLSYGNRVATMVSLPNGEKGEGAIAKIPLDRPITKMDDSFFIPVPYH